MIEPETLTKVGSRLFIHHCHRNFKRLVRSTQASLRQHTTWQLQSMRSRVKELARRRRGQQEAATIWTRCQTKRWRRMVEGQQDLPGVRPGPALPTPSTPSPLLSLPRSGQTVGSRCQFCFQGTQCSSWWSRSGCSTRFPGVPGCHWTWTSCCKVSSSSMYKSS